VKNWKTAAARWVPPAPQVPLDADTDLLLAAGGGNRTGGQALAVPGPPLPLVKNGAGHVHVDACRLLGYVYNSRAMPK
jgi:hypothetical protein